MFKVWILIDLRWGVRSGSEFLDDRKAVEVVRVHGVSRSAIQHSEMHKNLAASDWRRISKLFLFLSGRERERERE